MSIAECEVVLKNGDSSRVAGRRRRSKAEKVYSYRAEHRKAICEALESTKGGESAKSDIREMIGFMAELATLSLGGIAFCYLLM